MKRSISDFSLVGQVMDRLVTEILEQKASNPLPPQDVLSKEFNVSKSVMREALAVLLARNMVDMRRRVGTRIRPMQDWRMIDEEVVAWRFRGKHDLKFLNDVREFRLLIEPRAAALAATRCDTSHLVTMRNAFETFRQTLPGDPHHRTAEEELRSSILAASGNQLFQQMAAVIRGAISVSRPLEDLAAWKDALQLHSCVIEAIARRDVNEAEAASIALIDFPIHLRIASRSDAC